MYYKNLKMQWLLFVYCLLPIGLTSLILVSLPLPSKVGKSLNSKLVLLGSVRIPYMKINIIQFLIGISIITFTLTIYTVYKHSKTQESYWNGVGLNPTCIRWRAERNFWICTTNVIIYWVTYVIYTIKNTLYGEPEKEEQEEEKDEKEEEKEEQQEEQDEEKEEQEQEEEKEEQEEEKEEPEEEKEPPVDAGGKHLFLTNETLISVLKMIDNLTLKVVDFVEVKKNN
jgi:flagellar biosynthesis GTPase FlhF